MKNILIQFIRNIRDFLYSKFKLYRGKMPYIIIVLVALILFIGGINLFVEFTSELQTETLAEYDQLVTNYVISYRSPMFTHYFRFMTEVGDVYGYLAVLVIVLLLTLLVFKKWKYVFQITLVLLLATVSNMMLKRSFDRARPDIEHWVAVKTLSYPSGHAMSAMAFYGFLIYLIYRFKMNWILKITLIILLSILILSIGISRIYLGVHFPSDIFGGFVAGSIWVFFCILIFNLIEVFRRDQLT